VNDLIPLIGLFLGIVLGVLLPINLPDTYSSYMSVAILACLDSVFGGIRASLEGKFDTDIFMSGFFGNAVLAAGLAYLGDRLNVPIYLAAVIVFGGRLFQNFAVMRREIINAIRNRKKESSIKSSPMESGGNGDEV
jgi:small basic protein